MKTGQISLILVCLALAAAGLWYSERSERTDLSKEILARSESLVQSHESEPLATLPTEDKLTLLHAYYNLGRYEDVVRVAETMGPELVGLEPERTKSFAGMIAESYHRLGRTDKEKAFRNL